MRDFLVRYSKQICEYLLELNLDESILEELTYKANNLEEEFYDELEKHSTSDEYHFEGEEAIEGLFEKFRLYSEDLKWVERDNVSLLALKLCEDNYVPPCPYPEEKFHEIQMKISDFILQRAKTPEDEISTPLLSGIPKTQVTKEQMKFIANNIIRMSHEMSNYVSHYDTGMWKWRWDCQFIAQYAFEKAAEMTYYVAKGKSTDGLSYHIKDAFTFYEISVPDEFQEKLNSAIIKLQKTVTDITSYIEKNKYNFCDKETWFRPIVFSKCLEGVHYALEQGV